MDLFTSFASAEFWAETREAHGDEVSVVKQQTLALCCMSRNKLHEKKVLMLIL